MKLELKARQTVEEYQMFSPEDSLAVGVSGGADSMALLDFLVSIQYEYRLKITVCHLEHGLRGAESLRDAKFVQQQACRLGLPFRIEQIDAAALARSRGLSVEQAARTARYDFLRRAGGPQSKICTAHTLSDNVETVLLNLTRGTGLRGLCGIPPVRENIVRPLIGVTREQVEEYCARRKIPYVTDSTNAQDQYTRNRLRHHVIPVLKELNPALETSVGEMTTRLRRIDRMTESLSDSLWQSGKEEGIFSRSRFLALDEAAADTFLLRLLRENGVTPSSKAVREMHRIAETGSGALELCGGCFFYAQGDRIGIRFALPHYETFFQPVTVSQLLDLDRKLPSAGKKTLKRQIIYKNSLENTQKIQNMLLKNAVDCGKINNNLILRKKQDGDSIALIGRKGTRSVKKLCQEQRISPIERRELLVLADENGPLWVERLGVDRRCVPDAESRTVLVLTVSEEAE